MGRREGKEEPFVHGLNRKCPVGTANARGSEAAPMAETVS
jgi:hypothetical protein